MTSSTFASQQQQSGVDRAPENFSDRKSAGKGAYEQASEAGENNLQAASKALNDAKDQASQQAAGAQDYAEQLAKTAGDKADAVAKEVQEKGDSGDDTVKDAMADAVGATKEGAEQVRATLKKNTDSTEEDINNEADDLVDAANEKIAAAKDKFDEISPEYNSPQDAAQDVKDTVTKATWNAHGKIEEKGAVDNITAAVCNSATATKLVALGASDAARARVHAGRELVINTVLTVQNTAEDGLAYLREKLRNMAAVSQDVAEDVAEDVSGNEEQLSVDQVRTEVEKAKGRAMGAVNSTGEAVRSAVDDPGSVVQGAKEQAQSAGAAAQQLPAAIGDTVSQVAEGSAAEEQQGWGAYVCSKTQKAYSAVKSRVEQEATNAGQAKQDARNQRQERLDRAWELQQEAFSEMKAGVQHTYSGAKSKLTAAVQ